MDLRDWLAGLAMQLFLEHAIRGGYAGTKESMLGIANDAYEMADAMQRARERP